MTEQECYELGYDNPATPLRELMARHPKDGTIYPWHQAKVNALWHGQCDRQNQVPRSVDYNPLDYEAKTGERRLPKVEFR